MKRIIFLLLLVLCLSLSLSAYDYLYTDAGTSGGIAVIPDSLSFRVLVVESMTVENATIDTLTATTGIIQTDSTATATNMLNLNLPTTTVSGTDYSFTFTANDTLQLMVFKCKSDASGGILAGSVTIEGYEVKTDVTAVDVAAYTVLASDSFLDVTRSATGVCTITIPSALITKNFNVTIKDGGFLAGTNNITIETESTETIDGSTSDYVISTNGTSISLKGNSAGTGILVY